jgi:hypothetical protein
MTVNGIPAKYVLKNGYAVIENTWNTGDKIELSLPMPVRKIAANILVAADHDKVALQRGPLVYCLEGPDNKDGHVLNLVFDPKSEPEASFNPNLLNGVVVITGVATSVKQTENGIQAAGNETFTAIPYYAWANRGAGEMEVWMATKATAARPLSKPTIAVKSKVSGSIQGNLLTSVNDLDLPANSNDRDVLYFHWWPKKDTTEWIQYDFDAKTLVSECSVYWYDDGPWGGCRIPESWRILYKSGSKWIPVNALGNYTATKDELNTIKFKTISTKSLRLEVHLPEKFSSGIYEWSVK